jgi:hypothetical protein
MTTLSGKETFKWLSVGAGYLGVFLILVFWCDAYGEGRLRGNLISVLPYFLTANFLLIVIGLALNIKAIKGLFAGIGRRSVRLLLIIGLIGLVLTALIAPKVHRIYYDENIYLNIGQDLGFLMKAGMCNEGSNIDGQYLCSQLEFNKQPYAYPYLMGLVFRLFGTSETCGFIFNNLAFCLSIITIFLIGRLLFESVPAGLYASLLFALIPENSLWGNTTAVEPSAALFAGLLFLSALLYLKDKSRAALFLLAVILPFSLQFRMESSLLVPLVLMLIFLQDRSLMKGRIFRLFGILSFALLLGHLAHIYSVRYDNWGSNGTRMDFSFFMHNLRTNSLFYLNNVRFPMLFTLLAFIGLAFRKDLNKQRLFLGTWFLVLWGVFLLFYAGSYGYGQDVRYSLMSFMPLALLGGLGLLRLECLFSREDNMRRFRFVTVTVVILCFLPFLRYVGTVGEEARQAREDHYYARIMADSLPDNSIVLTHNPNMFLLWGKDAAQASMATSYETKMKSYFEKYKGGVYFHFNFWCNTADPNQQKFCTNILQKYRHKGVMTWKGKDYTYTLYKLLPSGS